MCVCRCVCVCGGGGGGGAVPETRSPMSSDNCPLRCLSHHSWEHLTPLDLVLPKFPGSVEVRPSDSDATNSLVRQSSPHLAAAVFASSSIKGADCCPSAVVFRFVVGKKTSSVCQKAAARFGSLSFCWERPGIVDRPTTPKY